MSSERARRGPAAALFVVLAVGLALAGAVATRLTLDDDEPRPADPPAATADRWSQNVGRALPRPQDARPAERPEDPGGALQLLLLGVVVAGLGAIGVLAVRQARRAGQPRGAPSDHAGLSGSA